MLVLEVPMNRPRLVLVLVLGFVLLGCGSGGGDDDDPPLGPQRDDDDLADDDDDLVGDDDTHGDDDDLADDDAHGDDDTQGDDDAHADWPSQMEHSARMDFYADVGWLDDCEIRFESLLVPAGGADECPQADRTYSGQYQYSINTCQEFLDMAGETLPDEGLYAVIFLSQNQREIFTRDADGVWGSLGVADRDPGVGHYLLHRQDEIESIGNLVTELTFNDL